MEEDGHREDTLFNLRREVKIVGILDTVSAVALETILLVLGLFYKFIPSEYVWMVIYLVHSFQFCISVSLCTASLQRSHVKTAIRKCQVWHFFSRFVFDWVFPVECFFLIMYVGGNGSQYLWILCGVVNLVFRVVAERVVNAYLAGLKRAFLERSTAPDCNASEMQTIVVQHDAVLENNIE